MNQLSNLSPLCKKRKTIGRGGSRGGTSGRGSKGQKSRSGSSNMRPSFEGGQMPLIRRLPKRGFSNELFATEYSIINLELLESHFASGDVISKEVLQEKGLLKGNGKCLLKVLGHGTLTKKLTVVTDAISKSAKQMIEQSGGAVKLNKEI